MKEEAFKKLIADNGGRIEFGGEVCVSSVWDGCEQVAYLAQYADENGVHACPEGSELEIDCFDPVAFEDIDDETFDDLVEDIILADN